MKKCSGRYGDDWPGVLKDIRACLYFVATRLFVCLAGSAAACMRVARPIVCENYSEQKHTSSSESSSLRLIDLDPAPRPRQSAWHSDITNAISPHGVPETRHNNVTPSLVESANHPAPQRQPTLTPSSFQMAWIHANALSTKVARICMAQRHHLSNTYTSISSSIASLTHQPSHQMILHCTSRS